MQKAPGVSHHLASPLPNGDAGLNVDTFNDKTIFTGWKNYRSESDKIPNKVERGKGCRKCDF